MSSPRLPAILSAAYRARPTEVNLRNLRQCPAGGFYFFGANVFWPALGEKPAGLRRSDSFGDPSTSPAWRVHRRESRREMPDAQIVGRRRKACLEAWVMVPVERIELPTFGLQNRCSTAELNRRIEAIGAGEISARMAPIFGGSNTRLVRKGPEPRRCRLQGVRRMEKAAFRPPFRASIPLPYWQICCRPSSPRNQVPGMQTKPLRRA